MFLRPVNGAILNMKDRPGKHLLKVDEGGTAACHVMTCVECEYNCVLQAYKTLDTSLGGRHLLATKKTTLSLRIAFDEPPLRHCSAGVYDAYRLVSHVSAASQFSLAPNF